MISIHGGMRQACRLFVVLILSVMSPMAWAQTSLSPVDSLIAGGDPIANNFSAADYSSELALQGPNPLYHDLQSAWRTLALQVVAALNSDDASLASATAVREAYTSLLSRDALYRHRLSYWASSDTWSDAARATAQQELDRYDLRTDPWRELVDNWLERADSANQGSVAGFWYWLTDFFSRWQLDGLRESIFASDIAADIQPVLGNALLPHSQTRLAAALTMPSSPITPVYARESDLQSESADLAADDLAPLSDLILETAESLNYDPVKIFNHVQSTVATRWYAGAMQGAQRTLALGAGNDVDSAALLVSLLRAASIPARYETGIVRMPSEYLKIATGIASPQQQLQFLQRQGRAVEPVLVNGQIAAFDIEYTWVAALVPYANYRGAEVDKSGKVWVPLMPAVSFAQVATGYDFLAASGLAADNLVSSYQASAAAASPSAWLTEQVKAALSESDAARLGQQAVAVTAPAPLLTLLPASLPLEVRAVAQESASIPERLKHYVQIVVEGNDGRPAIDTRLLLAQLDGQRLTLSYMAATREIQNTINQFGGLYNTPAWLVSLRPQLRLNGKRVAVGQAAVPMGEFHNVSINFSSPFGEQVVQRAWLSGGYYAMSIVAQDIEARPDYSSRDVGDTEFTGARLLSQLAARYNRAWLNDETTLAMLTGYHLARPWPRLSIAANGYRREYVLDRLQSLQWQNVTLDAALNVGEPVSNADSASLDAQAWTRFNALQGSWRESEIFTELFAIDAISADKGLRLAAAAGTNVLTLTDTAQTAALTLPAHVVDDINAWLSRGFVVTAPELEVSYQDWQGAVWAVDDPSTGSSGYFISGGLAGGAAAQRGWPVEEYQRAMTAMYVDPQNASAPVGQIRKLGNADWQVRAPGEPGEPIMVQVVDTLGNPIVDTTVHFSLLIGDVEVAQPAVQTDASGIAAVDVTFGTRVDAGVINFIKVSPADENYTRVGSSLVDVWVTDLKQGTVHTRDPFRLQLKPGDASLQHSSASFPTVASGQGGLVNGVILYTVVDAYGNAVSNADVRMDYSAEQLGEDFQSGGFVDSYGCSGQIASTFCAISSISEKTSFDGQATATYINGLGNANQTVSLFLNNVAGPTHTFEGKGLLSDLAIVGSVRVSGTGSTQATRVGKELKSKKFVTIAWPQKNWTTENGHTSLQSTLYQMIPAAPAPDLQFISDYMDISYLYHGNGEYELFVTGGEVPGVDVIRMQGHVTFHSPAYRDAETGEYVEKDVSYGLSPTFNYVPGDIWVVDPQVVGVLSNSADAPTSIILAKGSPDTYTRIMARVLTSLAPAGYRPVASSVQLRQGEQIIVDRPFLADNQAWLENGIPLNVDKDYSLVYVLNGDEITSEPVPAPLFQPIFEFPDDGKAFGGVISVDLGSDWSCTQGSSVGFTLNHPAMVTASVNGNELMSGELLAAGYHSLDYSVQPGLGEYSISAQSSLDGHIETRSGEIAVTLNYDPLPIGNTVVEGVNVHNGNLSLNRVDFQLGGRGPGIELSRFYNLNGATQPSPFGVGWGSSLNGYVKAQGCNAYQIGGGLGGGGRFYLQGDELVPAKGYHGTLKQNGADNSFDFYAKDGSRYHYKRYGFNKNDIWSLEFVEDTNGNKVLLDYDLSSNDGKLLSVTDSAGRKLSFVYNGDYAGDDNNVALVGSVLGPDGYQVDYTYDDYDRLISAAVRNEGNDRVETYSYAPVTETYDDIYDYLDRNNIESVTDALGYQTQYSYLRLPFNHLAGVVPNVAVDIISKTTEQNGTVSMDFDYSDRRNIGAEISTDINNFRGNTVHYSMDGGGRLLSQSLPQIEYEWYSNDILLKTRTEHFQGGVLATSYVYDQHGNITSETLNAHPAISRSWYPPSAFANGAVKNRLKQEIDANGHVTDYFYDDRGNLTEVRHPEGVSQRYAYAANGDRTSARDGNNNLSVYSYDSYGYVAAIDAADCCDMRYVWSALGYKQQAIDGRHHTTTFSTDRLGRVLAIDAPEGVSESFSYDAVGNLVEHIDRRGTQVEYAYDEGGRAVSETWPLTGTRTMAYDPHGNLIEETDFRGLTSYHQYDPRDHLIATHTPSAFGERSTSYSVDEQGNVTVENHGDGRITERVFNDFGQPVQVIDANDVSSYRSYDDVGNLLSSTDRRGNVTSYVYDEYNRLVRQDEPLGRTLSWQYDGNGNVSTETDANGNRTVRTWSQHGKPLTQHSYDKDGEQLSSHFYRYDNAGNLEEESNSRAVVTAYSYDKLNRLTQIKRPAPLGNIDYLAYDGNGNILTERWPNGNVIQRQWDERNRLLSESDNLGARSASSYDNNGNLLTETDARGTTVTRTWTDFNQVLTESLPQHNEGDLQVSYEYDIQGNLRLRHVTDTLSGLPQMTWETRYDLLNRPTHELDPLARAQITSYDAEGNPQTVTNRRGKVTSFVYDALNRLTQAHEPLGRARVLAYDPQGNLISEQDGRGLVTRYDYDGLNRRTDTVRNELNILHQQYDGEGNLLKSRDANGNITSYEYYDANLLKQETGEEAAVTQFGYDTMGNRTSQIDPENHLTQWDYDVRQRQISQRNALNELTGFEYDANGNRSARISAKGYRWEYDWTLGNQLRQVQDPEGGTTVYGYDGRGNRLTVTDGEINITRWYYDLLGRLDYMEYPDGRVHRWLDYDGNNNLLAERDPRGLLIEHDYDDLDRESARRFHDNTESLNFTETYAYDLNNNLTSVTETRSAQSWTTTSSYDDFDRLTHQQDRFGQTVTYSYDANGNRTRLLSSAGHATEYRFDKRNRVSSVINAEGENRYSYLRNSLLKKVQYGSGASATYSYDAVNRISAVSNQHNGAVVSSYSYDYDANGNRTVQTESNGFGVESTSYQYDQADRLTSITYPNTAETYSYDSAWNRATEVVADGTGTVLSSKVLSYNSRNQLTGISDTVDAANNASFSYDELGNQISKTKDSLTTDYIYDSRNHLRDVTVGGSTVGQFLYDYRGMRTEKLGDRGSERYSYDDQSVLFQSDASNTPVAKYEYGPNRLLSLKQSAQPSEFYLFDALSSPVTLVRKDGSISARYAYDAWGEKRHESGGSFNRFGFTGHEHDTETGLIYAKARYYDPDTARFLSQDPFAGTPDMPPSLHKYLYAYQNPTVYVDPDGMRACGANEYARDCDEGTGAANNRKDYASLREQAAPSSEPSSAQKEIDACRAKGGSGCAFKYGDTPSKEGLYNQHVVAESGSKPAADATVAEIQQDMQRRASEVAQIGSTVADAGDIGASILYWPKDAHAIAAKVNELSVSQIKQYWSYLRDNPKQAAENAMLYAAVIAVCKGRKMCGDGGDDAVRTVSKETRAAKAVEGELDAAKGLSPKIRALSESNITENGITVLGSFQAPPGQMNYIQKATTGRYKGSSYFDLGGDWNPVDGKVANQHFLDIVGGRGDKIIFSTPENMIPKGGSLEMEVEYLKQMFGYKWVNKWSMQRAGVE